MISVVGLDGDDTLWHSEVAFQAVEQRFRELLSGHVDIGAVSDRLLATERANLERFGYGVKSFVLSMIETAIDITEGRFTAHEIGEVIDLGKWLLDHPIELLPDVSVTLPRLAARYRLLLVTKGDLMHQEAKVAASGLADHFAAVEIVSEKDGATYRRVLDRHGVSPGQFVMVGNSLRSDVVPVVDIGGRAVHLPHEHLWAAEGVDDAIEVPTLSRLGELPELLHRMDDDPPGP